MFLPSTPYSTLHKIQLLGSILSAFHVIWLLGGKAAFTTDLSLLSFQWVDEISQEQLT